MRGRRQRHGLRQGVPAQKHAEDERETPGQYQEMAARIESGYISNVKYNMLYIKFVTINSFSCRIYQKYILRDFSPIALFFIIGFALMLFGGLFGAYHWFVGATRKIYVSTGTIMISILPLILGFQLLLQAIVLDINNSPK